MHEVVVSTKGQVVIPAFMREALRIKAGSVLIASLEESSIVLMPKPSDPIEAIKAAGEKLQLKNIRRKIKEE